MDNIELKDKIKAAISKDGLNKFIGRLVYYKGDDLGKDIVLKTQHLPATSTWSERIWGILNDIVSIPTCPICGKTIKFNKGYGRFCSISCSWKDPLVREARINNFKKSCMEKYGVDNPFKAKQVREKIEATNISKYGVENPFMNEGIKTKIKETNIIKYGVENPFMNEDIKAKIKETNLKKYNVDNPQKSELIKVKTKKTLLDRYGVEYAMQSEAVKNKSKDTCMLHYGVEYSLQSHEVIGKIKNTLLNKYGVDNVSLVNEVVDKRKNTCLKLYGVTSTMQLQDVKDKSRHTAFVKSFSNLFSSEKFKNVVKPLFSINEYKGVKDTKYPFECLKCNTGFYDTLDNGKVPRCPICFPVNATISSYENELVKWLESIGVTNLIRNTRDIIPPMELDIYLPDYSLAIEIDGVHFHSEVWGKKDKYYHLNKTKKCEDKGIRLVHIFDNEWIEKNSIVKSILLSKMHLINNTIPARLCSVKVIDNNTAKSFVLENHLQKPVNCKFNFGLFYEDTLVYVIGISKPRFNKEYDLEIIRSCGKVNTVVIGGFSKLLSFIRKQLPYSFISYVDRRYFGGESYREWQKIKETSPSYFYVDKNNNLHNRMEFQKHKIETKDGNLSEWENMQMLGYDRIWDCGNFVFSVKPTTQSITNMPKNAI